MPTVYLYSGGSSQHIDAIKLKKLKIYFICKLTKMTCQNIMDSGRRYEFPIQRLFHSKDTGQSISYSFALVFWVSIPTGQKEEG